MIRISGALVENKTGLEKQLKRNKEKCEKSGFEEVNRGVGEKKK